MNRFSTLIRKLYSELYFNKRDYLNIFREYNLNYIKKDL